MSATVTYKGNTLTTVHNTTKTLETAGTWLEDNITIVDDSTSNLQSKTVNSSTSKQTVTADSANTVCFHPFNQRCVNTALKDKIFH